MFLKRRARTAILAALERMPAVVLIGSRQVGKTTLARSIVDELAGGALYLDLERAADARRLEDADRFLRSRVESLVAIDEVQRRPGLFPELRSIIDDRRRSDRRFGQFLLLGSASLDLLNQSSESLAGRVAYVELEPLDVVETASIVSADVLWLRGGFPESALAFDDASSFAWRRDFIRTYLERDVPMFGPRLPARTIGRLWTMLAHAQGGMLNVSGLARNLAVSAASVDRYIDLLADLFLVRKLPPWSGNVAKRLVRAPKVYLRDSGIAHALLEIEDAHALAGHPVYGSSYEAFVIENLLVADAGRHAASFFRTQDGAEIDLVLERGGRVEIVVEIKRSSAPTLSRGFHLARTYLEPRRSFVVYPGIDRWPIADGVEAISLEALVNELDPWQPG